MTARQPLEARGVPSLDEAERVIRRDTGRNVGALAGAAAGGLAAAAIDLAGAEQAAVAIVTGFYIPSATRPAAETDGPPGAALLAERLAAAGIPALLVTDRACAPVVAAVAREAGIALSVADDAASVDALAAELRARGVTHVVFVERPGPAADGETYTMHGEPISRWTAPLHRLALEPGWRTVGIGDGGNEIGMGRVPHAVVEAAVEHGAVIHCAVSCDALVVAGVSNWGAVALGAAVALLRDPARPVSADELVERHEALLAAALAGGAVDGTTGEPSLSVDGVELAAHAALLRELAQTLDPARTSS